MAESSTSTPRLWSWDVILVLAAIGLVLLWPGDVSWLMDEPRIIANAWHANHAWRLADGGLYGNFGIRYGPFPTQVYQLLLLLTNDPLTLVVLRAALCAGVTGIGLLWLGRSLALPGWFAAAALVSPHVVAFQRVLWDASFTIPISTLALAGLASFLRTGRAVPLRVCVTTTVLLPLIHPQALALAVPIAGWLGWYHRRALWQDRKALLVIGTIGLVLHAPYLVEATGQVVARFSGSVEKGYPGGAAHTQTALAPLLGGRLLSGADYLESLARPAEPAWLMQVAQWMARLIYPLGWLGIGVCLWQLFYRPKIPAAQGAGISQSLEVSRRDLAIVLLLGVGVQAALGGLMRIPAAPQYFFGTFALHVLLAWIAVDLLNRRWGLGTVLGGLYGIAGVILTLSAAKVIHEYGFERPLWPTLQNSVQIAQELNRFSDTAVLTDDPVLQRSPQLIRTLRLLLPPSPAEARDARSSGRLFITSHQSDGTISGKIRLVEHDAGTSTPAGGETIDVTPLPRNWVPDPAKW